MLKYPHNFACWGFSRSHVPVTENVVCKCILAYRLQLSAEAPHNKTFKMFTHTFHYHYPRQVYDLISRISQQFFCMSR